MTSIDFIVNSRSRRAFLKDPLKNIFQRGFQWLMSKSLDFEAKGKIIGITDEPLTQTQKEVLSRAIPWQRLKKGGLAIFDLNDLSDQWSIDFLVKLKVPRRVIFVRGDFTHLIYDPAALASAYIIRPPMIDVWRYALETKTYFQYVILATEACNYRCVQCPFHSEDDQWIFKKIRPKEQKMTHLSLDNLERFLADVPPRSSIRLGGNGEPFLHPQIFQILERLKKDEHEIMIQTNGSLLTSEKLKRLGALGIDQLNFGIEGITPEDYAATRQGGSLPKIIATMDECLELRRKGQAKWMITINYSLLPNLSGTSEEVIRFYRGHADRLNFSKVFIDPCCEHTFDFDQSTASRIIHLPKHCFTILHGPVLGPTGLVFPCGLMSNAEWFVQMPWLKHIKDMPLNAILESYKTMLQDEASAFRTRICNKCTFWAHAYRDKGTLTDAYYHTELL